MTAEDAALFKQSRTAIMGQWGCGVSYVYFDFFGKRIRVLQPGSFRFESGATYGSKLAIIYNNAWSNGYVLSLEQSLFLC